MLTETITGYEPRFDFDVRRGKVGEEYVGTILEDIASSSIEVKTDYGFNKTGNVYVEFEQQKVSGEWAASGIASSEAKYWVFAFANGAFFIEREKLKDICRQYYPHYVVERAGNSNSSATRGIILPVEKLMLELDTFEL